MKTMLTYSGDVRPEPTLPGAPRTLLEVPQLPSFLANMLTPSIAAPVNTLLEKVQRNSGKPLQEQEAGIAIKEIQRYKATHVFAHVVGDEGEEHANELFYWAKKGNTEEHTILFVQNGRPLPYICTVTYDRVSRVPIEGTLVRSDACLQELCSYIGAICGPLNMPADTKRLPPAHAYVPPETPGIPVRLPLHVESAQADLLP